MRYLETSSLAYSKPHALESLQLSKKKRGLALHVLSATMCRYQAKTKASAHHHSSSRHLQLHSPQQPRKHVSVASSVRERKEGM